MRSLYLICLLIAFCTTIGYALGTNNSSDALLQERSNVDLNIKKDCVEGTTTSERKHKPTPTPTGSPINYKCCKKKDKGCVHEPEPKIKPKLTVQEALASSFLMVFGIFFVIYGFPMFRFTIALTGFAFGCSVSWIGIYTNQPAAGYPNATTIYFCSCFAVGIIVAIACVFLYKAGLYLLCCMAAVMLAIYICCWHEDFLLPNIFHRTIFTVSFVILFILGLIFLEFVTVILSMGIVGTYMIAVGADLLAKSGLNQGLSVIMDFSWKRNSALMYPLYMIVESEAPTCYNPDWKTNYMMGGMIAVVFLSGIFQAWLNKGERFGLRVIRNTNDTLHKMQ